jgi:hypothetical protein
MYKIRINSRRSKIMRKMKFGFLLVFAVLILVATASAALPTSLHAVISNPYGTTSYWDVNVDSITPAAGSDISTKEYIGWCADSTTGIYSGSHTFLVYSSLTPASNPVSMQWNAVNWILNNKGKADMYTVQAALWHYDGGPYIWGSIDATEYARLIAGGDAAIASNFVPGDGQVYAVALYERGTQPIIIEVPVPTIPSPEFPTLAAPIGMLIGVVGAAQYIKTRKE